MPYCFVKPVALCFCLAPSLWLQISKFSILTILSFVVGFCDLCRWLLPSLSLMFLTFVVDCWYICRWCLRRTSLDKPTTNAQKFNDKIQFWFWLLITTSSHKNIFGWHDLLPTFYTVGHCKKIIAFQKDFNSKHTYYCFINSNGVNV